MNPLQCERLAAETITERDTIFYSEREIDWQVRPLKKEMPGLNVTQQDTGTGSVVTASFSAAFHPSQDA